MQKYKKVHEIGTSATYGHSLTLTYQYKILCYTVFKYPDQSFKHLFDGLLPHRAQPTYNTKFQNCNCGGKPCSKAQGNTELQKKTTNPKNSKTQPTQKANYLTIFVF